MNLIIEPELEKCLPPLPEIHYQKLKASIEKKYDPAKPIVLWRERPNTIVDGHHRYRACLETGQEPTTIEESFASLEDAVLYALQRQIEQRNLTVPQLISVTEQMTSIQEKQRLTAEARSARTENLKVGNALPVSAPGSETGRPSAEVARKIAEKAHVSPREVYRFHKVKEIGSPELVSLMEAGEVGTKTAESFAKAIPDKSDQKAVIESGGQQAVFEQARQKRKEEEAKRAAQKEAEAKQIEALRNAKQAINNDVKEFNEYVRETFGEAKNVCFKGAKVELWCSDCSWGFDVYNPNEAKTCPYCSGINIKRREPDWWPGKKVI